MSAESLKAQIIQKAWADPAFKSSLLANPKQALKDAFGIDVPAHIELKAVEEKTDLVYLVIPVNPEDAASAASNVQAAW